MATDARVLLSGLDEYSRVLEHHTILLKGEFNNLDSHWRQFSSVYEGEAADQFRAGWARTTRNFEEYIEQTDRFKRFDERIAALREADKTESGLIG
jgi:uncharacterized protein YukE